MAKPAMPTMKDRFRPQKSAIRPPSSSRAPNTSEYRVHDPGTITIAHTEGDLRLGERNIHDGAVEHDGELGERHNRQK
jgi:hypothetical protein